MPYWNEKVKAKTVDQIQACKTATSLLYAFPLSFSLLGILPYVVLYKRLLNPGIDHVPERINL